MNKSVRCIMLVDDNPDDNFFHERVIKKYDATIVVIAKESALEALEQLKAKNNDNGSHPDLIFLDINMPGMNGWEFLEQFNTLDKELQSKAIVVMLTTSENPDDKMKAMSLSVPCDFRTKPLTPQMLEQIIQNNFS